jgi:uncharacterized protein
MHLVAWNGNVTLISPELAGFRSDRFGDFACGNVLAHDLDVLIERGSRSAWVAEYRRGLAQCHSTCPYFEFCGGGHPANRYFEHGRLDVTETNYCQNGKIALVEGVLDAARRNGRNCGKDSTVRIGVAGFDSSSRALRSDSWVGQSRNVGQQDGRGRV